MSTPISRREPTCTIEIVEWLRSNEDDDANCLAKVVAFAIRFFGTILCFISLIGIPLYVHFTREDARQELEAELRENPAPAVDIDPGAQQRRIDALTLEVVVLTDAHRKLKDEHESLKKGATMAADGTEELAPAGEDDQLGRLLAKSASKQGPDLIIMLGKVTDELLKTADKASKLYEALEQVKASLPADQQKTVPLFSPVRPTSVSRVPATP